jgi:hypothetical protein
MSSSSLKIVYLAAETGVAELRRNEMRETTDGGTQAARMGDRGGGPGCAGRRHCVRTRWIGRGRQQFTPCSEIG